MKVRKAIAFTIVACMLFAGVVIMTAPTASAASYTQAHPAVWPLYTGQNIKIGEVQVYDDGTNVYVRYVITTPGWKITEIHLDMANSVALIPQHNGNPTPGHFAIKHSYSPGVTATGWFTLPLHLGGNHWVYIAAHAIVNKYCASQETALRCANDHRYDCTGQETALRCANDHRYDCIRRETAWGGCLNSNIDNNFPGHNWARYMTYGPIGEGSCGKV